MVLCFVLSLLSFHFLFVVSSFFVLFCVVCSFLYLIFYFFVVSFSISFCFFFFLLFFWGGGGGGFGLFVFSTSLAWSSLLSFFPVLVFVFIFFPLFFISFVLFCLLGVFLFAIFTYWSFYFFLFSLLGFYFLFSVLVFSAFGGCFSLGADRVFFCFVFYLGCKQTYDSWRLVHVVSADVVIADVGDQALDIFLHGHVQSLRTRMASERHSLTHPFPSTLLKQRAKPSTHRTLRLRLVVLFLSSVVVGDGQEAWQMLISTAPTSEDFSPRTVLTENICRCVQQIEHRPAIMPFLTTSTITFSCLASAAPQTDSW